MNKPRKLALAVLASITIAGIAGASASSLGGLSSTGLGSDDAITASCQPLSAGPIGVKYLTVYNETAGRYDVDQVQFTNVSSACDLKAAAVTLADASKVSIGAGSAPSISVVGNSFTLDVTNASANAVEGISLVIQG